MSTEAEKLLAWISDQGIKAEMLDEEVREALSCEASSINNSGVSAQINTLLRCYGNVEDVKAVVMKVSVKMRIRIMDLFSLTHSSVISAMT